MTIEDDVWNLVSDGLKSGMVNQSNLPPAVLVRDKVRDTAKTAFVNYVNLLLQAQEVEIAREVLINPPAVLADDPDVKEMTALVGKASQHVFDWEAFKRHYAKYSFSHGGAVKDIGILTLGRYHVVDAILSKLAPKTLLEVGCGDGTFTDHILRRHPCDVTIADMAEAKHVGEELHRRHPSRVNFHAVRENLTDWPNDQFDVVLLMEIIEHVRHDDQIKLLEQVMLRGKQVVLTTPDAGFWGFCRDPIDGSVLEHVRLHTKYTLRKQIELVGGRVVHISVSPEQHLVCLFERRS